MKFTILTTVLLGLLLTPALADNFQYRKARKQVTVAGGYQVLTIDEEWHVATLEQVSTQGSWKTIWNYNNGIIATKVLAQRSCFLSMMARKKMPSFDALVKLAEENKVQDEIFTSGRIVFLNSNVPWEFAMGMNFKRKRITEGQGQPAKEITYIIKRSIRDLRSYGLDIFTMCKGLTTYVANEVHRPRYIPSQESCTILDVLQILDLKYCYSNQKA